ncbi:coiled-coil domain-containing protein 33-like [Acanthaster planci]|uniref:Coiled-coil domain-containing protein 33-like n=1 Tax=Acanthaster planci TaxID=133434 RepID=A0A8B7ZDV0_ACAPL|nr:coiled-coil domain-containing protein 33-like [Acanthaster planci]
MDALRIEEKTLLFEFELTDCILNTPGSYYIKLSIQCAADEAQDLLKQVRVWPGDDEDLSEESVSTVTSTVDVTEANADKPQKFADNSFTFCLPKGLCSPNAASEVILQAEVFPYTENDVAVGTVPNVGQATFTIYPRTSTPFIKLVGANQGENLYKYGGTLSLRKLLAEDGLTVLGGRLNYQVKLRLQPDKEPEPEVPPESPAVEEPPAEPEPSPVPTPETDMPPPLLRPKTTSIPKQAAVSLEDRLPRKEFNPRRGSDLLRQNHISRPDQEDVIVIIHAASNLPRLPDGSAPRAYVAGTCDSAVKETTLGICTTHSVQSASTNPTWEEAIRITVPVKGMQEKSGTQFMQDIKLQVIHETSRDAILEYRLPLNQLQPFHHYHLDLVQDDSHLFISVLRRQPLLTRLDDSLLQSQDALGFHGLEVLLQGVEEQLANPVGPLIATARLVPDLLSYRHHTAERNLQALSLIPLTVAYPDPHPSSFLVPQGGVKSGSPQVSLVGLPEDQPCWQHGFLFTHPRELASLFTDVAALALQFYPASSAFNGEAWLLHTPSGYCAQLLDTRAYHALRSDRGRLGIRVNLPLQGSDLKSRDDKTPHISIILRLITSMRPDSLAASSDLNMLPSLPTFYQHELKSPEPSFQPLSVTPSSPPATPKQGAQSSPSPAPRPMRASTPPPVPLYTPRQKTRKKIAMDDDDLPSHNAMRDLLPSNKYRIPPTRHSDNGLIPTRLPPSPDPYKLKDRKPKPNSAPSENFDKYTLSLMDAQQKELSSYREALNRMGEEIVRLQENIGRLEADNSKLRQRINMYEDASRAMVTNDDLDDITKAELLEKYVVVRQKLARQVSETTNYRDQVLKLQNDMIKQNDREQLYLSQQDAQSAQANALQEKQMKIKKLERTCREQEKALEKMEKLLLSKRPKNAKQEDARRNEVDLVAAENARLKAQIEQIRVESANKASRNSDAEKMMMQLQLEKSKSRIQSLERELMEKAREWGKQKESLRLRMGEQHQSYNQRALPPLRDRGYNHYSDDELDRGYRGLRQHSPVTHPYF